jgi:hypothetical protein
LEFEVAVPEYPFFHPKDTPVLVEELGHHNCETYGVYDGEGWVITKLAQKVKANEMLRLRSRDVTECLGITHTATTGHSRKRQGSHTELDSESPPKSRLKSSNNFDTFDHWCVFHSLH